MAADPSAGRAEGLDAEVAGDLYRRHHRRVYAFCLAQLRNADEAADATQTTFVRALAALRRGVDPTLELPWLFTIARNVCRSRWEARRRRRHLEVVVDPGDLAELAAAPETPDALAGLDDALATLPEPQRRAVVLRDWQGLSYKEVADELGVTLAAAETLIFRGRSALARELSGDEMPRRRAGLSSLLGLFKTGLLGGGSTAKVVIGTVAVAGVVAAGTHELSHTAARPAHHPVVVSPSAATPAAAVSMTRAVTPPTRAARRRAAAKRVAHVRAQRQRLVSATPAKRAAPRAPSAPPSAPVVTAPASASVPEATAPAATPTAATPTPAAPASAPAPAAAPTAPAPAPAPAAATPAPPPASTTTVTDAVTPVVTQVTGAADPVVTTVTDAVAPVVTTATDAVAPVVTTVTQTLPPLPSPPPVHLP